MTPAKPGMQQDLIEPLREFLESFTQELTEQQFIPAFREELRRLLSALERIQESGDTLQQIATGVDRLREVFAPSGTRMLEGVKELEGLMRNNADGLKTQAEEVLTDLLKTHNELENALRAEAGVLQEQTSVSKDTLSRTASEIEERFAALSQQIDGLCRKTETEVAELAKVSRQAVSTSPAPTAAAVEHAPGNVVVKAEITDDLQRLLSRTETVVSEELSRYQSEVREALQNNTKENNDRLARVDKTIEEALKSVGPRVQEELDSALERLRDQIQTLATVEAEVRQTREQDDSEKTQVSDAALKSAITASENRILRDIKELRKTSNGEISATQKALEGLVQDLGDAADKHTERLAGETHAIKDALARMERTLRDLANGDEAVLKKLQEQQSGFDNLAAHNQEQTKQLSDGFEQTFAHLKSHSESLDKIIADDKQSLNQLKTSLGRIEDIVTRSSQTMMTDSRTQRDKIEAALGDLLHKVDTRMATVEKTYMQSLEKLSDDWSETLLALNMEIDAKFQTASETLLRSINEVTRNIQDTNARTETIQKDLANELKRSSGLLDDRFEALQENTKEFTGAMESHVKAVSGEVSKLRSKQEEQLAVLKEAIRANYDDNAERLKETIDAAYDKFLDQVRAVPQALERYSKFIESLHKNDRLALEALQNETENILRLQTEKFEELTSTTSGVTKLFPLMDKKLEKQGQILEAMRRSQIGQDKEIEALKKCIAESRQETLNFTTDVKGEQRAIEVRTEGKFSEQSQMLATTFEQLEKLQQTDMPAFRQELKNILSSKFEFMETTQTDRDNAWRKELTTRLDKERKQNNRVFLLLGLLTLLTIALQVSINFDAIMGLLP